MSFDNDPLPPAAAAAIPATAAATAVKLLLVDDQPVNLVALEAVLAPLGVPMVRAHSGTEALRQLLRHGENDFAAILLDVQMPAMDGFETARLIKERERSRYTPLLFITAAGDNLNFQKLAYEAGAVDFLPKPFVPEVLLAKVSVFVDLHRQREELRLFAQREQRLQEEIRQAERERELLSELAKRESEKAALAQQVQEMSLRQRRFLREMLFGLTEGRLHLCDTAKDLPKPLPRVCQAITLTRESIRRLRQEVVAFGEAAGWSVECIQDLETAVGEAAMNAVVHGHGGRAVVRGGVPKQQQKTTKGTAAGAAAQVWIEDKGGGIAEASLHRATLERGYTTAGTLGHGFWMILRTAHRVHLLTGEKGTTVVLEQERNEPQPAWMKG